MPNITQSERARRLLAQTLANCKAYRHQFIMPEHLLLALANDEEFCLAMDVWADSGVLRQRVKEFLDRQEVVPEDIEYEPEASEQMSRLIDFALMEVAVSSAKAIDLTHLVAAMLKLKDSWAAYLLKECAGGREGDFLSILVGKVEENDDLESDDEELQSDKKAWRKLVTCMNDVVGQHNPLVGREEELQRTIQVLCRRDKNNPLHVGEPGVGKTAIVWGLARLIVEEKVPERLRGAHIYQLDMGTLLAGTQFRGDFEKRIKQVMDGIMDEGDNNIVYIDEIHTMVGAGATGGGAMDASNMLKPYLESGRIRFIGSTTYEELNRYVARSKGLTRRFQQIDIQEPSAEEAKNILRQLLPHYEEFHGVQYEQGAVDFAVEASARHINDRFLPDKAIDLIDEACSDVNLKNADLIRADEVEKEIGDYARERELLASAPPKSGDAYDDQELEHRYARIAELRSREMQLQTELDALRAKGRPELTADNLARIIELWTKIPAASIRADEFEQLAGLGDRLRAHIVGQDAAIDTVCAAIRRNRVGLQAKRKPVSFLFVGGTGVGKTELVKRLADELFHAPESLIRLDMSEFMEKFSVSRMIGSPPGYVGYDEAGQLTEKIRRRPYSVVLFDEIEKAHPDVMNLLLQILDDGRITDAQGRTVNFENTVIILTTNAGSNTRTGTLGFGLSADDQSRERAQRALNEFLRPEFLNRLDEIVYFNHLTEENFRAIASLMLGEVRTAMAERGMTLHWTPAVIDYLVARGYSETYGARNLRRTIQRDVEDAIASAVVAQRKAAGDVAIDAQNDRIVVTIDGKEVTA